MSDYLAILPIKCEVLQAIGRPFLRSIMRRSCNEVDNLSDRTRFPHGAAVLRMYSQIGHGTQSTRDDAWISARRVVVVRTRKQVQQFLQAASVKDGGAVIVVSRKVPEHFDHLLHHQLVRRVEEGDHLGNRLQVPQLRFVLVTQCKIDEGSQDAHENLYVCRNHQGYQPRQATSLSNRSLVIVVHGQIHDCARSMALQLLRGEDLLSLSAPLHSNLPRRAGLVCKPRFSLLQAGGSKGWPCGRSHDQIRTKWAFRHPSRNRAL
mmetsp:Transcript_53751/g.143845  ORF Transcript_53751/g.143845 Transcript_53751/m.143845 type:complete len:263 (-) Transcript_53751:13-801(-)